MYLYQLQGLNSIQDGFPPCILDRHTLTISVAFPWLKTKIGNPIRLVSLFWQSASALILFLLWLSIWLRWERWVGVQGNSPLPLPRPCKEISVWPTHTHAHTPKDSEKLQFVPNLSSRVFPKLSYQGKWGWIQPYDPVPPLEPNFDYGNRGTQTHTHTEVHKHTLTEAHKHTHTHTNTHSHTLTHTHSHTLTHTLTHTFTHTHHTHTDWWHVH